MLHISNSNTSSWANHIRHIFNLICLGKAIFLRGGVYLIVTFTNPPPSCSEGLPSFFLYHFVSFCMIRPTKSIPGACIKMYKMKGESVIPPATADNVSPGLYSILQGGLSGQNIRNCTSLRTFHFRFFFVFYGIWRCATWIWNNICLKHIFL